MNPDAFAAADVVDGRLVLSDEYRAECLELFDGDAGRLTVALKQASGEVQLNSQRSIEQQLNRILGRIAGERRDRRSNYEAAVKANAKTPPAASKIPTYMQRY